MARSDAELVVEALEGDKESFELIVARFQGLVFNIAYHYLGRREEVEDLAQDVFLKVFQTLERYDTARPLKHWIGKIAVNRCLDELRRRKIRRLHLASDLGDEDRKGIEQLRRPATTWKDRKTGVDCDDYTIFIASILYDLGKPFEFRITKYSKPNYQHIYLIVPLKNKEYVTIDPVLVSFKNGSGLQCSSIGTRLGLCKTETPDCLTCR